MKLYSTVTRLRAVNMCYFFSKNAFFVRKLEILPNVEYLSGTTKGGGGEHEHFLHHNEHFYLNK